MFGAAFNGLFSPGCHEREHPNSSYGSFKERHFKDHLPPTPGYKPSLFGGTDDAERGLNFHVAFRGEVKGSTSITCTEAPPVDNVH